MSTTTPYTDAWRERTASRMRALGITRERIAELTGLHPGNVRYALESTSLPKVVDLETAGPIDELLDKLEAASDARAIEAFVEHPGNHRITRVRRVDGVDLGRLTDTVVTFTGGQWVEHPREPCTGITETCPDMECSDCAERDCPFDDPLHYHHDGCPSCAERDDEAVARGER